MLFAIGGKTNGAVGRVMERGDLPTSLIDETAKDGGGTRTGGVPGLNLNGGTGGAVRPGIGHGHGLRLAPSIWATRTRAPGTPAW